MRARSTAVCLTSSHSHRSSFFLIGFYSFALACLALILKFGVLEAINPPNETLRGVFVLSCCIAGFGGGGVAIFFWKQAKYFVGAWGGFALALWIQCFRAGGLIRPIGFRWIMYIGESLAADYGSYSSYRGSPRRRNRRLHLVHHTEVALSCSPRINCCCRSDSVRVGY